MKEQGFFIDILAIVKKVDQALQPIDDGKFHWHKGIMHPQTKAEIMRVPPGVQIEIPMQLEGVGEGELFEVSDIFENLTPKHWDGWRSDS